MFAQGWMVPMLGGVVLLALVAVVLLVRSWPRKPRLSPEELADIAETPMPTLQKRAWLALSIGIGALAIITAILSSKGATSYWVDDDLRLVILGIFMVGLLGSFGVTNLQLMRLRGRKQLDERDRAVLARAPTAQMTLVVLGVAAWVIGLTQHFHDEGTVPVVYLYLMFGSVILLMMIGQSLGILLGYWFGVRNGEG